MTDFMNSPSMNYLRVAGATGELATGAQVRAEVVALDESGMATLRVGRQQVRILPDRPLEVGQQLTVRLTNEGGQLRLAIVRLEGPGQPAPIAPAAVPEVNVQAGGIAGSTPTDALLQQLGLPVNVASREAVEALVSQGGAISRGNVAAVVSAAAEAFPGSPAEGVPAAAFLVSRGVPPEMVLVRAVGQLLSMARYGQAGLPGEVLAAGQEAVARLGQVGLRMPEVEQMLSKLTVETAPARGGAQLAEGMRVFQDASIDAALKDVGVASRMVLNRSATLVRIDYAIGRIRAALGQSGPASMPAAVAARSTPTSASGEEAVGASVRPGTAGAPQGQQALLDLPGGAGAEATAIPEGMLRQARAVVQDFFNAMDNRAFQGPGFNLPESSAELNHFLRVATGALSSHFRQQLERAMVQLSSGRPEAVPADRAGMILRTLPELDVLGAVQKLIAGRIATGGGSAASAETVAAPAAALADAVDELAELFRGPVTRESIVRIEQWVRSLDPSTLRQASAVLRMSITGGQPQSVPEASALNQLWAKVPALEVIARTFNTLRMPIATPLIANAISETQYLEQTARAAYSGVTRAFQRYVADMVHDRSPQLLAAMEHELSAREQAVVRDNAQLPSLQRLSEALTSLRDEAVAFKAAAVLRGQDQPAVAFGHLALSAPGQRMPMVVRVKARFPRRGGRPPGDDATTVLLDVQTSRLGGVAAFMVAHEKKLDTTFFVERSEVARAFRGGHAELADQLRALGYTPTLATRIRARTGRGDAPPDVRELFGTQDLPDLDIIA